MTNPTPATPGATASLPSQAVRPAAASCVSWRTLRANGRAVLMRSMGLVWVVTPMLPVIGAAISWYLGV